MLFEMLTGHPPFDGQTPGEQDELPMAAHPVLRSADRDHHAGRGPDGRLRRSSKHTPELRVGAAKSKGSLARRRIA